MKLDLSKSIPVEFGSITGNCFGGRYRDYDKNERRLCGVKMAAEINHPHDVSIPTEDFSVPRADELVSGMCRALSQLARGSDIYAGCMGGIGRTGLFMGVLCKALIDYHGDIYKGYSDPVVMVRSIYYAHAIETQEQMAFVREFDTSEILRHMEYLASKEGILSTTGWVEPDLQIIDARPLGFWGKLKQLILCN